MKQRDVYPFLLRYFAWQWCIRKEHQIWLNVISVARIWIGLHSSKVTTLLHLFHPNMQVILITRNSNGSSETLHQPTGGNIKVAEKQMIIQLVYWISSCIYLYYCQKHYRNSSITFYIMYSFPFSVYKLHGCAVQDLCGPSPLGFNSHPEHGCLW
jgi:hypothetical protein